MATDRSDGDLLTERLLRVIDEGRRVSTYKLALLLAIIDEVAANPGATEIGTGDIARSALRTYVGQVAPYASPDGSLVDLRQISAKSSPVLRVAETFAAAMSSAGCRTVEEGRAALPDEYASAVRQVETTFVGYPIPLLQVVGGTSIPFLYEVDWPEGQSAAILREQGRDRVRLLAGVADRLIALGPLIRPLIELHWVRDVARWSRIDTEDDRLRSHLFGAERVTFPARLRADLADLQHGACFYCGGRLGSTTHVDHFLAWSRWPNDAVENLVVTDSGCNLAKKDHLADTSHARRWRTHVTRHADDLAGIARDARWSSDPSRSVGYAVSTYGRIAAGTPLWRAGREFVLAEGPVALDAP
jgi:5-methylcytosine-specific restriction endonuclease McrA